MGDPPWTLSPPARRLLWEQNGKEGGERGGGYHLDVTQSKPASFIQTKVLCSPARSHPFDATLRPPFISSDHVVCPPGRKTPLAFVLLALVWKLLLPSVWSAITPERGVREPMYSLAVNRTCVCKNLPSIQILHCKKRILNSDAIKVKLLIWREFQSNYSLNCRHRFESVYFKNDLTVIQWILGLAFFRSVFRLLLHLNSRFSFYVHASNGLLN